MHAIKILSVHQVLYVLYQNILLYPCTLIKEVMQYEQRALNFNTKRNE